MIDLKSDDDEEMSRCDEFLSSVVYGPKFKESNPILFLNDFQTMLASSLIDPNDVNYSEEPFSNKDMNHKIRNLKSKGVDTIKISIVLTEIRQLEQEEPEDDDVVPGGWAAWFDLINSKHNRKVMKRVEEGKFMSQLMRNVSMHTLSMFDQPQKKLVNIKLRDLPLTTDEVLENSIVIGSEEIRSKL
jgi:hypothetical protein